MGFHHALDRDIPMARRAWRRSIRIEQQFSRQLRKIARHIADMLAAFNYDQPLAIEHLSQTLNDYADLLHPWATSVADRMIREVAARDDAQWRKVSKQIGVALRSEFDRGETGQAVLSLLDDQVRLIKSIPLDAAERVRKVANENFLQGSRAGALRQAILEGGEVSKSQATLIARTETARTGSVLSQVRAQSIGCTHFIWRTAGDSGVRPSHRKLNGQVFRYDDPPICDPPDHRALPGQIWNCRCIAQPVLPDDL